MRSDRKSSSLRSYLSMCCLAVLLAHPALGRADGFETTILPEWFLPTSVNAGAHVAGYLQVSTYLHLPATFSTTDGSLQILDGRRDASGVDALLVANEGQVVFDRSQGVGQEILGAFFQGEAPKAFNYSNLYGDIKLQTVNSVGYAVGYGICGGSMSCPPPSYQNLSERALLVDFSSYSFENPVPGWPVLTENTEGITSAALDINDSDIVAGAFTEISGSGVVKPALFQITPDETSPSGRSLKVTAELPSLRGSSGSIATAITNMGTVLVEHQVSGELSYTLVTPGSGEATPVLSTFNGSPVQVLGLADNEAMVGKTLTGGTFVFKKAGNDEWVSLSSPELIGNLPWQIQEVIQYTPEGFLLVKASLEQPGPDLVRHLLLQPSVES